MDGLQGAVYQRDLDGLKGRVLDHQARQANGTGNAWPLLHATLEICGRSKP
jgi:hypothetical protein